MSVAERVLNWIRRFGIKNIFVTRQLLGLAKRSALDQVLHRLVKKKVLRRLARGVFIGYDEEIPEIEEIVRVKAKYFGKKLAAGSDRVLNAAGLINQNVQGLSLASNGKSSSLKVLGKTVKVRGTMMNMVEAGDTNAGKMIRAFFTLGRKKADSNAVDKLMNFFGMKDRRNIAVRFPSLMTGWMSDLLLHT